MRRTRSVAISCSISRSAFSGERVFRLVLADRTTHVGTAPTNHCRLRNGRPVNADEPQQGSEIDGLVDGLLIENAGETALIALPDGATVRIANEHIHYPLEEAPRYVPVGS